MATRERIHGEIQERLAAREARKPSRRRRILAEVLAAAVALVIALGGITLLLSRNALPGDALYGIKRAGENAELGLAFGDSAKGQKHLQFAASRLDELKALGDKNSGAYRSALTDFRREATAGTAELTQLATQGSGAQLDQLRSWSVAQNGELVAIRQAAPAEAQAEFTSSEELLDRIEARALLLMARLDCFRITTGVPDELGAVPQPGACEPSAGTARPEPVVPGPAAPTTGLPPDSGAVVALSPTTSATSQPTPALPPSTGRSGPSVVYPPVVTPTSPRAPAKPVPAAPVISIPPLLPGLPGVGIG